MSYMRFACPYGADALNSEITWARCLGVLDIEDCPELPDVEKAIRNAIENPIGLDRNIYSTISPGETVAVLVSDQFRQTCAHQLLPVLIAGLNRAGIPDRAIAIIFAGGVHRHPTPLEQAKILGEEIYCRFQGRTHVHDACDGSNLVHVGATSRGTPVIINRLAHEADRIIVTGTVMFHYFGGYGGGRKSVVPGIASAETISHNHSMNLHPRENRIDPAVRIGILDGNPVAEDMLEGARMVGVDYIINTVLNRDSRIAGVFAGELDAAHRSAAEFARKLYSVPISERADLVVASSGTAKNFIQAHKALYNAYQAVKPNGRIVFLAKCEEGLGGETFAKWLHLGDRDAIIAGLRKQSEINGQTALSTIEKTPKTIFVTDMSDQDTNLLRARRADSLEQALETARKDLAAVSNPTCYVMPSASYTIPFERSCI